MPRIRHSEKRNMVEIRSKCKHKLRFAVTSNEDVRCFKCGKRLNKAKSKV